MKTWTILIVLASACTSLKSQVSNDFGRSDNDFDFARQQLDGLWIMDHPRQERWIKHYYMGRVYACQISPSTGVITFCHFGRFKQTGGTSTERLMFATEKFLLNKNITWKLGFAGNDVYSQEIPATKEVWSRVNSEAAAKTLESVMDFSREPSNLDGVWYQMRKDLGCIKILDKGRLFFCEFDSNKKLITSAMAGIYSIDESGVLRERATNATEALKGKMGNLDLYKVVLSGNGSAFRQTGPRGRSETWTRWGEPPAEIESFPSMISTSHEKPKRPLGADQAMEIPYVDVKMGPPVTITFDELPNAIKFGVYGMATVKGPDGKEKRQVVFVKTSTTSKTTYSAQMITSRLFDYYDGAENRKCQGYEELSSQ